MQALTGRVLSAKAWTDLVAFRAETGIPWWWPSRRRPWGATVGGSGGSTRSPATPIWCSGGPAARSATSSPATWPMWTSPDLHQHLGWRRARPCACCGSSAAGAGPHRRPGRPAPADPGRRRGGDAAGMGLYRAIHLPGHAATVHARLAWARVRVRRHGDTLLIAPPLTVTEDELTRFGHALKEALAHG
ncbi:MAG: hypothetical protein R3F43_14360 [bacterium]